MSLDPTKPLAFSSLHRLQWEEAQQRYVILYPEGIVELNVPSAEILKLCDGQHNAYQIVEALEAKLKQTGLLNDIFGFLEVALAKNWILSQGDMAELGRIFHESGVTTNDGEENSHKLAHFEDCASAIDGLFQQALIEKGESAFGEFLDFAERFSNLSVYNAMLVRVQRPGAAAVASRKKWQTQGRHVKPDAIPIVILQPFGPVRFVFEFGDTEGQCDLFGESDSPLYATGEIDQKTYDNTRKAAVKYGVEVVETDQYGTLLAGTAAGVKIWPAFINASSKTPFRVKVNAKHDLPTRFATLAHELGHIYCGHVGNDPKHRWPNRSKLPSALCEMEAEAVAWLVCQRNGVTSRSKEYLSSLIKQVDLTQVSMYAIFESANRVESRTIPHDLK